MIKILVKLCNRDSRTVYRDDLCYELADMLRIYLNADALPGDGGTVGAVENAGFHSYWTSHREGAF